MSKFNVGHFFLKYWLLIVVITLIVFAISLGVSKRQPPSYFGSQSVTVQAVKIYPHTTQLILQTDISNDTQLLVATTQSWFNDPAYVQRILDESSSKQSSSSLKDLSKLFKIVVAVPNSSTYQVEFTGSSQDEVQRTFTAMKKIIEEQKNSYNQRENSSLEINLIYSDVTITNQSSSLPLVPLAGLTVGLLFSITIASLLERQTA